MSSFTSESVESMRIAELFGDSAYQAYQDKRLGIESCKAKVDVYYAYELQQLLKRAEEKAGCDKFDECCCITDIKEQIRTL
jgi:hypothetical protein